jgi:hypothetical protein
VESAEVPKDAMLKYLDSAVQINGQDNLLDTRNRMIPTVVQPERPIEHPSSPKVGPPKPDQIRQAQSPVKAVPSSKPQGTLPSNGKTKPDEEVEEYMVDYLSDVLDQ